MSATISGVVCMWAKGIRDGGEDNGYKQYRNCNVYYSGPTLYSYGSHFPMAHILAPGVVWLNGDRYSVSTSRHQAETRGACTHATTIIVPNSALQAAGVDYRTIIPVDVKPESYEYTEHRSDTPPASMIDTPRTPSAKWAGSYILPDDVAGYVSTEGSDQIVCRDEYSGEYVWHTARHWLGDTVFRTPDGRYFVSSFDRQESRPLYFLSQLPGPVDTFEEAIESLAPDSVKTARDMGREVVRQGDMFAIPMDITTRELRAMGATFERRRVTVKLTDYAASMVRAQRALAATRDQLPAEPKRPYWRDEAAPDNETREQFAARRAAYEAADDDYRSRWAALATEFDPGADVSKYHVYSAFGFEPTARDKTRTVDGSALYGTAHTATEVATLPNGQQFARGTLYHEPALIGQRWRQRDHARQPLGNRWHLVARNTVPVNGTGNGRTGLSGLRAS